MSRFPRILELGREIPGIAHRHGVLKAAELKLAKHARSIIDIAEDEAKEIIAAARRQAAELLVQQQEEIERRRAEILQQAESVIWRDAEDYQRALDVQFQKFAAALEEQTLVLLRKAITMLAHEMPAEQKIAACVRTLYAEVGRPAGSTLVVNEADCAALQAMTPPLVWPMTSDAAIAPGTCKLVAQNGEWQSSFAGRLACLLAVLDQSCLPADQLAAGNPDDGAMPVGIMSEGEDDGFDQ